MKRESKSGYLKLILDNQKELDYKGHVLFPLYLNSYEEAIRNIFFNVLWEKEANPDSIQEKSVSNIYSFLGGRGSGKTTAMGEFCRILERMNDEDECKWWIRNTLTGEELRSEMLKEKFYFKVLEPIDASSLEVKEDLFELILAGLYQEYEKGTKKETNSLFYKNISVQEIVEEFMNVIEAYHAIKNARNEDFGDSYITRLKYMSSSIEIRKKIDILVGHLLKDWRNEKTRGFLVIAIDDLDLNIRGGYEMLEQLRKYFFNPNIIIALAVDYEQINRICEAHYIKEFTEGKFEWEKELAEQGRNLSRDYIAKVLPVDRRIFMPDIKRMSGRILIELDEGQDNLSTKKYLMRKIGDKLHIFYDSCGTKLHFCEAYNVREMVNYCRFLDTLGEVDFRQLNSGELSETEQDIMLARYNNNSERFNWDIIKRMANRLLNEEYKQVFDWLLQRELARRAVYVYGMMFPRMLDNSKSLTVSVDYEANLGEYSYGKFLEIIYRLGRVSDLDKNLIKCILASFTSEMVRENVNYIRNSNPEAKRKAEERLKKFLGKSFGSKWTGAMLPLVREKTGDFGYSDQVQLERVIARFNASEDGWLKAISQEAADTEEEFEEKFSGFYEWVKGSRLIPTVECVFMFFSLSSEAGMFYSATIELEDMQCMVISGRAGTGILDILGFIPKTLSYEEECDRNQHRLATALTDCLERYISKSRQILEKEKKWLEKNILAMVKKFSIHSLYNWDYKNTAAFPFYDFDMAYNIMKRARNSLRSANPELIDVSKCYEWIKKVYEEIERRLVEQEEVYGAEGCCYGEAFRTCPFVEVFLNADKYLHSGYPAILGSIFYQSIRPAALDFSDEPEG